ncbi:matrix-remodeling-associated protein 7-like isoform X5 [Salvelinus fontinalis]|uniref:matrix-remodeling-associated protein 7-like isoform X5 n=1 Tax=Salvelinus fontinalis TaxID=8038 RepID=UPI0024861B95|nr:matrix-remodeling-associated protein 7-like isoform X5 [Salvelinus fontinalis]
MEMTPSCFLSPPLTPALGRPPPFLCVDLSSAQRRAQHGQKRHQGFSSMAVPEPVVEPEPVPEPIPEPESIPVIVEEPFLELIAEPDPVSVVKEVPVREPTPEPAREPKPKPAREPTPEPIFVPEPEDLESNAEEVHFTPGMKISKLEKLMTKEEMEEEQRVQNDQLAAIFLLLMQNQEALGEVTEGDMEEQLKLYSL